MKNRRACAGACKRSLSSGGRSAEPDGAAPMDVANLGLQKAFPKAWSRFSEPGPFSCNFGLSEVVVPEPVETAPDGKQKAVYVDSQTAVKVLNRHGLVWHLSSCWHH